MSKTVILGEMTCPSGELVAIDAGYLGLWSGTRSPDEIPASARRPAKDLGIVGEHALVAAGSFDRQPALTRYDIPTDELADFTARFERHCAGRGLDARLEPIERVPHRQRAARSAAAGGGEFIVFGVPAVAVGGVPTDRPLPIVATRAEPAAGGSALWHSFRVLFADRPVARRRQLGFVGVDHARVLFADADALSTWRHDSADDGMADVAIWGSAAEQAAAVHGAKPLDSPGDDDAYGWRDLPTEQARALAVEVLRWQREDQQRELVVDFRPHSDYYRLMAELRVNPVAAGTVTVGGADMVGAVTGCRDGLFQVHAEYDADGAPVGVQVLFSYPDHLARIGLGRADGPK